MNNPEDISDSRESLSTDGQAPGSEEKPGGIHTDPGYVHLVGNREELRLDQRFRFRVPDQLAGRLHRELGRVSAHSQMPPGAFERISFYFVPGPSQKIFLYPSSNIQLAITRFQKPLAGADPAEVRAARDYFYSMMTFVEADRQNRLVIPEHLREHAGLQGNEQDVLLSTHDLWLVLMKRSLAAEQERKGRDALDQVGADILDPVQWGRPPSAEKS